MASKYLGRNLYVKGHGWFKIVGAEWKQERPCIGGRHRELNFVYYTLESKDGKKVIVGGMVTHDTYLEMPLRQIQQGLELELASYYWGW